MTDSVDPVEKEYLDAIAGDPGPAEPTPEELYVKRVRAGESVEPQEETQQPVERARDSAGRFVARAEESEEAPQELSSHEAVDYLMGRQVDEAELERRAEEERQDKLRSGEAVRQFATEARITGEMLDRLRAEHPGIDSPEAIKAMQPIFDRVAEEYGARAEDPLVLRQIFQEVGGSERFTEPPEVADWRRVFPTGPKNAFTQ